MAVVVRDKSAVRVLAKRQRQALEHLAGPVPGEAIGEQLDRRLELRRHRAADDRIRSVGADDEVGARRFG